MQSNTRFGKIWRVLKGIGLTIIIIVGGVFPGVVALYSPALQTLHRAAGITL
jgi:hypothetical protein